MTRYRRGVSRRYLRPGVVAGHVLVLAAALTCLRLGWWQWNVFEAARGTAQNLGYALLWPVFAGSFIYMWLRFLQLEGTRTVPGGEGDEASEADEIARIAGDLAADDHDVAAGPGAVATSDASEEGRADEAAGRGDPEPGAPRELRHTRSPVSGRDVYTVGMGYIDDGDEEDDPELAAYNRALAALAEQDERRDR